MKLTQNQFYGIKADLPSFLREGSTYLCSDTKELFIYIEGDIPFRLVEGEKEVITRDELNYAIANIDISDYIIVVANFSTLPDPTTVDNRFFYVNDFQGSKWLPGTLGGTYYPKGIYYSNGISWSYIESPYQASQAEVNAGLNVDKFVSSLTLDGWWINQKTLAQTFLAKIIFNISPRLSAGTANTVVYLDGLKDLVSSTTTSTELAYLTGVTDNIQAQFDQKLSTIRIVSTNDSVLITDTTILVDTSGGNRIITYNPVTMNKKIVNIKKTTSDTNTVTITPSSGTIDGLTSIAFNTSNQSIPVHSNGTNLYTL